MTFHYDNAYNNPNTNDFNSKIMISAIFSLSFVIFVVILLYMYARCALRVPPRQQGALTPSFIFGHRVQHVNTVPIKTGLDPLLINSLIPLFVFKQLDRQDQNQDQDEDQNECAVCLSMLENNELARQLPNCNHIFHVDCIDSWLTGQPTCPVCRADVMPRLGLLDREPPRGDGHAVVSSVLIGDNQIEQNQQSVISKVISNNNSSGPSSSSSSFRLSSFKKIIGRERSFNSRRIQVSEEIDLERQGH